MPVVVQNIPRADKPVIEGQLAGPASGALEV